MTRKGQAITLSVSQTDKAELEKLAEDFGMTWGDRPNISKLVEAIARRKLILGANNNWSDSRIRALDRARNLLIDGGQIEQAEEIGRLLLERSEISMPLRNNIENFLGKVPPPWRLEIDRLILQNRPFQLSYQDAAGKLWEFSVRHAVITPHEKRQYLDCWCEEIEGSTDIEELRHNWCFRLDRISEATVIPMSGHWRTNLAQIEVEMHLFSGLASAYQAKPEDKINEWMADKVKVRRVIRLISSSFWFIREIMQYTPDCVIISPDTIREKVKEKINALYRNYELE
jgi:hypothetical protein